MKSKASYVGRPEPVRYLTTDENGRLPYREPICLFCLLAVSSPSKMCYRAEYVNNVQVNFKLSKRITSGPEDICRLGRA